MGWMVLSGEKSHVKGYIEGLNMLASMRLCSNVLAQSVVQTSLGGTQSVDKLLLPGDEFMNKENSFIKPLMIFRIICREATSCFLYFPKIDREMYKIDNDEQFVLDFLKQEKILLVHGRGFNWKDLIISDCLSASCR